MSVKITRDVEGRRLFGKALVWSNCRSEKGKKIGQKENREWRRSDQDGYDHDLTISRRRSHDG